MIPSAVGIVELCRDNSFSPLDSLSRGRYDVLRFVRTRRC